MELSRVDGESAPVYSKKSRNLLSLSMIFLSNKSKENFISFSLVYPLRSLNLVSGLDFSCTLTKSSSQKQSSTTRGRKVGQRGGEVASEATALWRTFVLPVISPRHLSSSAPSPLAPPDFPSFTCVVSSLRDPWVLPLHYCGQCHLLSQVLEEKQTEEALEILAGPMVKTNLTTELTRDSHGRRE